MNMQKISPKARKLWLIRNMIWLAVITAAMAIALLLCSENQNFIWIAAIACFQWLVIAALLLIWPGLQYRFYAYGYDEKRFCIHSGVIFRHSIVAPICQIQDLHLYEGPLMRILGLGKIMLATGGSNFELHGLEKLTAVALIEDMENKLRARLEVQENEEI